MPVQLLQGSRVSAGKVSLNRITSIFPVDSTVADVKSRTLEVQVILNMWKFADDKLLENLIILVLLLWLDVFQAELNFWQIWVVLN